MDVTIADQTSAEEYVRALFRYVLDRKVTTLAEVHYWSQELLNGRSAAEVLRLFVDSEENQSKQRVSGVHHTKYPNGHFYSPVVNVDDVRAHRGRIFGRRTAQGVELEADEQIRLLRSLARYFQQMPFGERSSPPLRYYFDNTSYGFGDACIYWGMIANLRPRRIVEIGSGFTSALALDAIQHFDLSTNCTFIDPNPELLLKVAKPISDNHEVIVDEIQNVDPGFVEELGPNDLLFIDSSHVVKTGSDVHFELTELLPRLQPGVVVHFHDVFYPFEYPPSWVIDTNLSWNELYFIHTFLMYNSSFRILYFNHFIATERAEALRQLLPEGIADRILLNPGGGLWMQRQ